MAQWVWQEFDYGRQHSLLAVECRIDIYPRPTYCDRGRWGVYVLDKGYPINPSPVDTADMFPRLFFSLDRAKAEMEEWMTVRKYTPKESLDDE